MPRNMSFSMTTKQYQERTKTVTRRLGWWHLKPGDVLNGVEKAMGLKRGEKVQVLGQHRVINVRSEPLNAITRDDCVAEGFPEFGPLDFVQMFCGHNNCNPDTIVNRIEFEYMPSPGDTDGGE